jgi:hypothetical protein
MAHGVQQTLWVYISHLVQQVQDTSGECTYMHMQHGISKTYLFQFLGRKVSSREVFFNTWTWKSTTWTLMNCNSQLNVYIHACVCLAVKLIRSVKRVKRVVGTWVCQVTELIKMFLSFPHIPMKTFCQGIKPVRDLVLCTYWRHWVDGRCYTEAVKRKNTFFVQCIYNSPSCPLKLVFSVKLQ